MACVPQGAKWASSLHIPFQRPMEAYIVGVTVLISDICIKREIFEILMASEWNAMV